MSRNMLFITGTNLERTMLKDFQRVICRDRDIRRLIRIGRYELRWKPVVSMIGFLVILSWFIGSICEPLSELIEKLPLYFLRLVPLAISFFPFATFASFIQSTPDQIKKFSFKWKELKPAFGFIFKSIPPKSPLELWNILQGSIMDAQITTSAERLFDTDVALIYGGMPYYELLLIDKIHFSWICSNDLNFRKINRQYNKFFRNYSKSTVLAEIRQKYYKDSVRLQISNCVFGILFFSEYLQSFIRDNFKPLKEKIYIDCSKLHPPDTLVNDYKELYQKLYKQYYAANELMGYCTNPSFFTFKEPKNPSITLVIDRIDIIEPKSQTGTVNIFKRLQTEFELRCNERNARLSGKLSVPIKKTISVPINQTDLCNPVPDLVLKHFSKDSETREALVLGGAEQNSKDSKTREALVLGGAEQNIIISNLVNAYKWRPDRTGQPQRDHHYYGFAENAFDSQGLLEINPDQKIPPKGVEYLIGTEGFVYGLPDRKILGKKADENDQRCAEIFRLDLDGFNFYFIYGYHAIATKISSLKFFIHLANGMTAYIPQNDRSRITYTLTNKKDGTFKELRDFWDEGDPINSDELSLKTKLNSISINL